MPVLCFGPVCIPLNLLLPFLLGIAHRYGWLRWIRREWLTFTWWKQQFSRSQQQPAAGFDSSSSRQHATAITNGSGPRYVCEGDVCRLVPPDAPQADHPTQQAAPAESDSDGAGDGPAAVTAEGSRRRHRRA